MEFLVVKQLASSFMEEIHEPSVVLVIRLERLASSWRRLIYVVACVYDEMTVWRVVPHFKEGRGRRCARKRTRKVTNARWP